MVEKGSVGLPRGTKVREKEGSSMQLGGSVCYTTLLRIPYKCRHPYSVYLPEYPSTQVDIYSNEL